MKENKTIAEMTDGIILASFEKKEREISDYSYQSEAQLEEKLIENLIAQGYERLSAHTSEELYKNLKSQMERLNRVLFSQDEWARFCCEYLDAPNDSLVEKTRKLQENHTYDFIFDDGTLKNIKIIDKKDIHNNVLQVVNQISQYGDEVQNRYDVSILVNGLPLVHMELKRRGVNIKEAFKQIHRYSEDTFNTAHSLYKYVQIFVISNGTFTRYFANTTESKDSNYQFTCEWADAKNRTICDLEDFTKTFFEKRVVLEVLTKYCVFNVENRLLVMRPYQIVATEKILQKINSSFQNKKGGTDMSGGFVWHTTGSGKTLTSFKTARLATHLSFIDKVFFVVDRKDLDYQTMREYQKFQADCVNGSKDTKELQKNIEKNDGKIVVTTIQKLNEFVKRNAFHPIYSKHCVFIFDECHRSQFGVAQMNIKKRFKAYYHFGFTGTPIFVKNAIEGKTTEEIFGLQLHSYVITDAIRDAKVLKFKLDYHNVLPTYRQAEENIEKTQGEEQLKIESKMLLHPARIESITRYVLEKFNNKTHRNVFLKMQERRKSGFNAMFAVQSIAAAKLYYKEFEKQQKEIQEDERLRVATIYSVVQNEEGGTNSKDQTECGKSAKADGASDEENVKIIGNIEEESFDVSALNLGAKTFLKQAIADYNKTFKTNFSIEGEEFQNYYKDLAQRVREREVDLLIVVGMFLTGFDAPHLNTLFVDKSLQYHGLIQAFSRTNRIVNDVKTAGNIVCFRDLQDATHEAIKTFGDENSINIILEKNYEHYEGQFKAICNALLDRFPELTNIKSNEEKKAFARLFGEFLTLKNILKNFDEFEEFTPIIPERIEQDMRSVYHDIRDEWKKRQNRNVSGEGSEPLGADNTDFSDIEFHIDLLKTEETTLDFIITLILEKYKDEDNIEHLKEEITRIIRSNFGLRAKEELIIAFIDSTDLKVLNTPHEILDAFYHFAKEKKQVAIKDVIREENLKDDAERFINKSIDKGYVESQGDELDSILPHTSRRAGQREKKKRGLLAKLKALVRVFVGL